MNSSEADLNYENGIYYKWCLIWLLNVTDSTELGSLQNDSLLTSREPSMFDDDCLPSARFDHPQPSGVSTATFCCCVM